LDAATNEAIVGGAFHRRFSNHHRWFVAWEWILRKISVFAGPLFGDQSIFVKAWMFQRLGGFADIPLMEDIEFTRRLRHLGRITLLNPPMSSSPRRFRRLGSCTATLVNISFVGMFYLGVSPSVLHRWYYRGQIRTRSGAGKNVSRCVETLSE
jgi:hypothetical protein